MDLFVDSSLMKGDSMNRMAVTLLSFMVLTGLLLAPITPRTLSKEEFSSEVRECIAKGGGYPGKRALDWTEWERSPISVDGNASEWRGNYTPHDIGRPGFDVDLYMANNESYLNICIDARSDLTDEASVNDRVLLLIDGDNDNWICQPIGSTTNESTTDNWITICGNTSVRSSQEGIHNDAGWLNTGGGEYGDDGVFVSQWFDAWNPYLQNKFHGYKYSVGFNGTPKNMAYEIGIPMNQWNWTPGDDLGACILVFKHGIDQPIGIWPMGFVRNDLATWKDFYLATPNDLPVYSAPSATPYSILNDNDNTSLLTVEANDPDGNISVVTVDLSPVGGASQAVMVDNGTGGDAEAGDAIFSCSLRVPSIIAPGTYNLSFVVQDDHVPNVGKAWGKIPVGVRQYNRRPIIENPLLDTITLEEDDAPTFFDLASIFSDPDTGDVLTYLIRNGTGWDLGNRSRMADYSILLNDTLRVLPRPDMYGTEILEVMARDSGGLWTDFPHLVTVSIRRRNDPPEIVQLNGSGFITNNLTVLCYEDMWNIYNFSAEDIDGDMLSYTLNLTESFADLKWGVDIDFNTDNGTLMMKPRNHHVGTHRLGIAVDDDEGGENNISFDMIVVNSNDAPFLENIEDVIMEQDEWVEIDPVASDEDLCWGDRLTFFTNFTEDFPGVLTEKDFGFDRNTGKFRFRPDWSMVGRYDTYIAVRDGNLREHRRDFTIRVMDVNDPPFRPIFNYTVEEGTRKVSFRTAPGFDPEGDALTYQWDFGDGTPKGSGKDVDHEYDEYGNYTATLWVTDGHPGGINHSSKVVEIGRPGGEGSSPWQLPATKFQVIGHVRDEKGNAITGATVKVSNSSDPRQTFNGTSDGTGRFEFALAPGDYHLTVSAEGFNDRNLDFSVLGRDKELDVRLDGTISGTGDPQDERKGVATDDWLLPAFIAVCVLSVLSIIIIILVARRNKRSDEKDGDGRIETSTGEPPAQTAQAAETPPVRSPDTGMPPQAPSATASPDSYYDGTVAGRGYNVIDTESGGGYTMDPETVIQGWPDEAGQAGETVDFSTGPGETGIGSNDAEQVGKASVPDEIGDTTEDATGDATEGTASMETAVPPTAGTGGIPNEIDQLAVAKMPKEEPKDAVEAGAGDGATASTGTHLSPLPDIAGPGPGPGSSPPPEAGPAPGVVAESVQPGELQHSIDPASVPSSMDKAGLQDILMKIVDRDRRALAAETGAAVPTGDGDTNVSTADASVPVPVSVSASPSVSTSASPPEAVGPEASAGASEGIAGSAQETVCVTEGVPVPSEPAVTGANRKKSDAKKALDELFPWEAPPGMQGGQAEADAGEPGQKVKEKERVSLDYLFKNVPETEEKEIAADDPAGAGQIPAAGGREQKKQVEREAAVPETPARQANGETLDELMDSLFGETEPVQGGPDGEGSKGDVPGESGKNARQAASAAGETGERKIEMKNLFQGLGDRNGRPGGSGSGSDNGSGNGNGNRE